MYCMMPLCSARSMTRVGKLPSTTNPIKKRIFSWLSITDIDISRAKDWHCFLAQLIKRWRKVEMHASIKLCFCCRRYRARLRTTGSFERRRPAKISQVAPAPIWAVLGTFVRSDSSLRSWCGMESSTFFKIFGAALVDMLITRVECRKESVLSLSWRPHPFAHILKVPLI